MAPMTRSFCGEDGVPGPEVVAYYAARAAAGTGLIITEGTVVDMGPARGYRGVPGLCSDVQQAAWARVTDAVHAAGARIAVQLWHAGRLAHSRANGGCTPLAPSAVTAAGPYIDFADPETYGAGLDYAPPRAMTESDIESVIDAFARAAVRAQHAGFDAIEFHGGSGYLIQQFWNADSNRRDDDFGGDVWRRGEFASRLVAAVRAAVGPKMPLVMQLAQFAVNDFGWTTWQTPDELATTLGRLVEAGCDGFYASAHRISTPAFGAAADPAQRSLAWHMRCITSRPVIAVGGVTYSAPVQQTLAGTPAPVEDPINAVTALEQGDADIVAIGRAMIANPDWVRLVSAGRWRELAPFSRELLMTLR